MIAVVVVACVASLGLVAETPSNVAASGDVLAQAQPLPSDVPVAAPRPAAARTEAPRGVPLSPEDAVKLALERSGSVRAAYLDAHIRRADKGFSLNPLELRLAHRGIDGALGTPHTDNDGIPYAPLDDSYVALAWTLPSPGDVVEGFATNAQYEADRYDAIEVERDFAALVHLLHAQTRSLRAEAALARNSIDVATQLVNKTNEGMAAGVNTSLDLRVAGLERLDAEADAEEVLGDALRAEHDLAGLIGLPLPLALSPPKEPLCRMPKASIDELVARASERSEKLAEHKARRERASFMTSLSWISWLPYVDAVQVGWVNEPLDERDAVRARVDIALPIFEPFMGNTRVADLELLRADAMHAEELRQIDARIRSAVNRVESAAALVAVHEANEKDIVEESLNDVARAIEAGATDILQLAEVQRRATRARRNLIRARFRCEEAAIELKRVTGDIAPDVSPAEPK